MLLPDLLGRGLASSPASTKVCRTSPCLPFPTSLGEVQELLLRKNQKQKAQHLSTNQNDLFIDLLGLSVSPIEIHFVIVTIIRLELCPRDRFRPNDLSPPTTEGWVHNKALSTIDCHSTTGVTDEVSRFPCPLQSFLGLFAVAPILQGTRKAILLAINTVASPWTTQDGRNPKGFTAMNHTFEENVWATLT